MIRRAIGLLLLLIMASAANAGDYLLPISPGEGVLDQTVDAAWIKVIDQDDMAFVRFDVEPTFNARIGELGSGLVLKHRHSCGR